MAANSLPKMPSRFSRFVSRSPRPTATRYVDPYVFSHQRYSYLASEKKSITDSRGRTPLNSKHLHLMTSGLPTKSSVISATVTTDSAKLGPAFKAESCKPSRKSRLKIKNVTKYPHTRHQVGNLSSTSIITRVHGTPNKTIHCGADRLENISETLS